MVDENQSPLSIILHWLKKKTPKPTKCQLFHDRSTIYQVNELVYYPRLQKMQPEPKSPLSLKCQYSFDYFHEKSGRSCLDTETKWQVNAPLPPVLATEITRPGVCFRYRSIWWKSLKPQPFYSSRALFSLLVLSELGE